MNKYKVGDAVLVQEYEALHDVYRRRARRGV